MLLRFAQMPRDYVFAGVDGQGAAQGSTKEEETGIDEHGEAPRLGGRDARRRAAGTAALYSPKLNFPCPPTGR